MTIRTTFVPVAVSAAVILFAACIQRSEPPPTPDSAVMDNAELLVIYNEDQSDRLEGGVEWSLVNTRDSVRRQRVLAMLDSNLVQTSEDYRHAAMVFQHGLDTIAARRAHELALTAVELDSSNANAKWLVAAAWDRYLMRLGQPQWYGTQYIQDHHGTGWRLYDIDTTQVTDEQRRQMHVPTLEEARARVEDWNN